MATLLHLQLASRTVQMNLFTFVFAISMIVGFTWWFFKKSKGK